METVAVDIDGQYRAMREGAGLLDRSARGKLLIRGDDAAEFLQGQLTNDVEALAPGEGCYAALLDRKGRMQGDLRVLRLGGDEIWLDAEAVATDAIRSHLKTYRIGRDVAVADVSEEATIQSLIGPDSARLAGVDPGVEHSHGEIELAAATCRAAITDLGVDLIAAAGEAEALRSHLIGAGAAQVTEEAAEILRVEAGRPRFGSEMTAATIPQEAGINDRAVSFSKGCYIGQETVARLHYKGKPNRHLRGLRLSAPARAGDALRLGEREVGEIGTACLSPALGAIGLAIVRREAEPGLVLEVGDAGTRAEVTALPFG